MRSSEHQALPAPGRARAESQGKMNRRHLVASPPWTAEEEAQLRVLAESGGRPAEIAMQLKRTEQAVRHRFYKLGIPLKPVEIGLKAKGK
jgi:hypothetical protein